MPKAITNKREMYRRLNAGELGNTVPAWLGLAEWQSREPRWETPLWGVRGMTSGDPRMRLDIPTVGVADYCVRVFGSDPFNISPMVDHWLMWRANVYESPTGLVVQEVVGHRDVKWRQAFANHAREVMGLRAVAALRYHLNENSHDDLRTLLDEYQGHVVELTALERCYGTVPLRNAIVWEVRCTTGEYERDTWGK